MITRRTLVAAAPALIAAPAHATSAHAGAGGYADALADAWGGRIDPRAAHRVAEDEVRRLHRRADRLLRGQGLSQGAVGARLQAAFADPRYLYPDTSEGRDRAVADMNAALAAVRPRLSAAFAAPVPDAQVRRMSSADEAARRGGYRAPGAYYVDLSAIRQRPAWTLPSVVHHETVPGHALQAAMSPAPADPPTRPRDAAIFSEAWAIYAEQLAFDLGAFDGAPLAELGYLHWRLFRMGRIVADTGQGVLGWSLDQAVAELKRIQGEAIAFATLEADAARMRRDPGVYAAQGLGALRIAHLRPLSRGRWPAFHDALLRAGPVAGAALRAER